MKRKNFTAELRKVKRKKKRVYRHFPWFCWRVTVLWYDLSRHNQNSLNFWRLVKLKITRNNKKHPPKKSFIYSLRIRWEPFRKKKAWWFLVKTNTVFFTLIRELSHFSIHSKDFVWKKNERIKKKELLNFMFYLFKGRCAIYPRTGKNAFFPVFFWNSPQKSIFIQKIRYELWNFFQPPNF